VHSLVCCTCGTKMRGIRVRMSKWCWTRDRTVHRDSNKVCVRPAVYAIHVLQKPDSWSAKCERKKRYGLQTFDINRQMCRHTFCKGFLIGVQSRFEPSVCVFVQNPRKSLRAFSGNPKRNASDMTLAVRMGAVTVLLSWSWPILRLAKANRFDATTSLLLIFSKTPC
jgi:hypothetical protein